MTDGDSGGGTTDGDRPWVSLFSGGKDSSWALHRAIERGLPVERLVTVHPEGDSYLYHVPATELAGLAAESVGLPLVDVRPGDFGDDPAEDSGARGDRELEPLERALADRAAEGGGLGGLVAGAVESDYQNERVSAMADRLGCDVFAPLWRRDPRAVADDLLAAGFEVLVVQVAARGLDESWLGRTLDREAFAELFDLREEFGVHPLGEGGEFETFVTDGPHMARPVELEYETEWDGARGRLRVTDARLG